VNQDEKKEQQWKEVATMKRKERKKQMKQTNKSETKMYNRFEILTEVILKERKETEQNEKEKK
jgi:hypothetical protein